MITESTKLDKYDPIVHSFPYGGTEKLTVAIVDDKVYVNGYEYINGMWKRTLKALWYRFF